MFWERCLSGVHRYSTYHCILKHINILKFLSNVSNDIIEPFIKYLSDHYWTSIELLSNVYQIISNHFQSLEHLSNIYCTTIGLLSNNNIIVFDRSESSVPVFCLKNRNIFARTNLYWMNVPFYSITLAQRMDRSRIPFFLNVLSFPFKVNFDRIREIFSSREF